MSERSLLEAVDPARVLADLAALKALTADADGAQRVAWTDTWAAARRFLVERLDALDVQARVDEAGNLWAELPGADEGEGVVAIGSHLDSVPDGGDYDGALGVLAGLEVLRAVREAGPLRRGVALIDFADEEGARFGHSLFGSTALMGALDSAVGELRDDAGTRLADAVGAHGVSLERANDAASGAARIRAYLELHVEQGPELAEQGVPVAAVSGASGIARFAVTLSGRSTHAGATAMADRRDPLLALAAALARLESAVREQDGLLTVGRIEVDPNVPTTVPATVGATVDLRHADAGALAALTDAMRSAIQECAEARGCEQRIDSLWTMPATPFDRDLVAAAQAASVAAGGSDRTIVSGRGHDAIVVASRIPTAMLFVPSIDGLSHCREERTDDEDIVAGVRALADLTERIATGAPDDRGTA